MPLRRAVGYRVAPMMEVSAGLTWRPRRRGQLPKAVDPDGDKCRPLAVGQLRF